jgi:hypothetical protein
MAYRHSGNHAAEQDEGWMYFRLCYNDRCNTGKDYIPDVHQRSLSNLNQSDP